MNDARSPARALWLVVAALVAPACPAAAGPQPWQASVLAIAPATPVQTPPESVATARPRLAPAAAIVPREQPSIVLPIAGGLLGGALGAGTGLIVGWSSGRNSDEFIPGEAAIGFVAGEAIVLPLGVHLGNGARGSFLQDLSVSILGGLAALGIGSAANDAGAYFLALGGQLAATVWVERHVGTRRAREAAAAAAAADSTRRGVFAPVPPPVPEPLVPPPPAER